MGKQPRAEQSVMPFPVEPEYKICKKDKYIFRVPVNKGFYFDDSDMWIYVSGSSARVGVTDYLQKRLSDIMYFTPPKIGCVIDQTDNIGELESGKVVKEIASPVSGLITAVNEQIVFKPDLINRNPYECGWIAEIELSDFESDKGVLYEFEEYFSILERKVDEYRVKD